MWLLIVETLPKCIKIPKGWVVVGCVRNNVTLADLTASCRTSILLVDSKLRDPDII